MALGNVKPSPTLNSLPTCSEKPSLGIVVGVVAFLLGMTLLRIFLIAKLPLTGDEAYYWEWSRHLALGYHDHPPLVGWLIALASALGKGSFWVRFPSIALALLSSVFMYLFTCDISGNKKSAIQSLVLFSFIPIFAICSLAIFPDAPLVFSWSLFLWSSWRWLKDERYWFWMGLAMGLAALSKLMGLFILPSLLAFLVFSGDGAYLKRGSFWKSLALAVLIVSPFLWWNFHHHFETFLYQAHRRMARGVTFSPSLFLNYLSLQFVSLSPFVAVLLFLTTRMLFHRSKMGDVKSCYLLWMAIPIHLFFAFASFFTLVGLHWALPGYLSIIAAVPAWLQWSIETGKSWTRSFFTASWMTAMLFTLFLFSILKWPQSLIPRITSLGLRYQEVNHGKTISNQAVGEILGYQELGETVSSYLRALNHDTNAPVFVLTDSYSLSSIIGFYANTEAKTILFTSTGGDFDRWNDFQKLSGRDALYVDVQPIGSRPDINVILQRAFKSIVPLKSVSVTRGGFNTGNFYFAHCVQLVQPQALRPHTAW